MKIILAIILLSFLIISANAHAEEVIVSADQVVQDYERNSISGDMKYKGKVVLIEGKIADISVENDGTPVIYLGSSHILAAVHCIFPKSAIAQLSKLETGQQVTIRGTIIGYSMVPHLKNAKIVNR